MLLKLTKFFLRWIIKCGVQVFFDWDLKQIKIQLSEISWICLRDMFLVSVCCVWNIFGNMSPNSLRSECRKFAPNIFNKTKCTNCFKQKEEHTAEALECNRVSEFDWPSNSVIHGTFLYLLLCPVPQDRLTMCSFG